MIHALRIVMQKGDVRSAVEQSLAGGALERFIGLVAAVSDPDRHRDVWLPAWSRPPAVPNDERWVEPGLWLGRFARQAGLEVPAPVSAAIGALAKRASLVGDLRGQVTPMVPEDAWAAAAALGWDPGPVLPGFSEAFVRQFGAVPATRIPGDWEAWRWSDLAVAVAGFGPSIVRICVTPSNLRLTMGDRTVRSARALTHVTSARVEVSTGRGANRFAAVVEGPLGRRKIAAQRARLVVEDDGEASHDPDFAVDGPIARFEWT